MTPTTNVTKPVVTNPTTVKNTTVTIPVTPPTKNTTTTTTTTTDKTALTSALKSALASGVDGINDNKYKRTFNVFYKSYSGVHPNNSNYYFAQVGIANTFFLVNAKASLTSYDQVCVSSETTDIVYTKNTDGSTTCSNVCVLDPKNSKTACNYLMNINKSRSDFAVAVNSWSYQ